ncbi:sensor histidine kinase [Myxococcus xanthus]|uniref:histidine kinase n=1 Tax=Myxococcus xanthus TaxID=34 RepID=A0A7Y4IDX3_MYXXA|nr:sensor histidine kinase [Myxococcus xanthus]NOJ77462.1 sensor histidine kinase [Myxococcus xanthus]NOJ84683.1 sensor histidine kinase [Myxococcus xanthus]
MSGRARFAWALVVGLLGNALNRFPVELIPGIDILLGFFLIIPAAPLLGPWCAGLAAGIAMSVTVQMWGHPWSMLGSMMEGVVLGALTRRYWPLQADGLFWLGGIPYLLIVSHRLGVDVTAASTLAIALKQALNSLVPALLTQVVLMTPMARARLWPLLTPTLRTFTLSSAVGSALLLALVLPLLMVGTLEGRARYAAERRRMDDQGLSTAHLLAETVDAELSTAQSQSALLASIVMNWWERAGERPPQPQLEELLRDWVYHSAFALNFAIGDSGGSLVAIWPPLGVAAQPMAGSNFADRAYFRDVRDKREPVVSGVFAGRGTVTGPVIVAAAPLLRQQRFEGFTLVAINLPRMRAVAQERLAPGQRALLVDPDGNVAFDTGATPGPEPQSLKGTALGKLLSTLPATGTRIYDTEPQAPPLRRTLEARHLATAPLFQPGWRVLVEHPMRDMDFSVIGTYSALLATLALTLVLAIPVTRLLTRLLSRPVEAVSQAAGRMAAGERDVRAFGTRHRAGAIEVEKLGLAFDEMAARLQRHLEEVERVSQAKAAFFSIASHELKTPLATLKLRLQRLRPDSVRQQDLVLMDRQVDRLARLVNQLLDVSELASGRLSLAQVPLELSALVRRVSERRAASAPRHPLKLSLERVDGWWDEPRLEQVVYNLVDNAIRYSPEGGPVEVVLRREGNDALLEVKDRGVGLGPRGGEELFSRALRGSTLSTISRVEGLGVGLYLSREIVTRHGGSIHLAAREGGGTCAIVRLPRNDPREA